MSVLSSQFAFWAKALLMMVICRRKKFANKIGGGSRKIQKKNITLSQCMLITIINMLPSPFLFFPLYTSLFSRLYKLKTLCCCFDVVSIYIDYMLHYYWPTTKLPIVQNTLKLNRELVCEYSTIQYEHK